MYGFPPEPPVLPFNMQYWYWHCQYRVKANLKLPPESELSITTKYCILTLHVKYAQKYGILFIFITFYECSNLEHVRVPV